MFTLQGHQFFMKQSTCILTVAESGTVLRHEIVMHMTLFRRDGANIECTIKTIVYHDFTGVQLKNSTNCETFDLFKQMSKHFNGFVGSKRTHYDKHQNLIVTSYLFALSERHVKKIYSINITQIKLRTFLFYLFNIKR